MNTTQAITSPLSKAAVKRLRKVEALILKEPRRFDMGLYASAYRTVREFLLVSGRRRAQYPPCGTTACIAGWTVLSQFRNPFKAAIKQYGIRNKAIKLLGIDDFQAIMLFHANHWPEPYQSDYANARTLRGQAKVAVARIEHFIETGN